MDRENTRPRAARRRSALQLEALERRNLLTSVPYGAAPDDTAEYMLGDVLVSVVLMESDGREDPSLEDWAPEQVDEIKQRVQEGLQWWESLLAQQATVHSLNFQIDFTYADRPVQTAYEPISRRSDDFTLWIDDFFQTAGIPTGTSFSDRIRQYNHAQRLKHDTNWAYTIFVVNASNDADSRFDAEGSFSRAFAFAGGRFFVTTSERPASTYAHETGHMFWAMDEYAGGRTYTDHRGYYDTQNLNALEGHPNPQERERSLMDSHGIAYRSHALSSSALETIGWRDSDNDGIFDVLDVPHKLSGTGEFDAGNSQYHFIGRAAVQTLPNQNPEGNGHDITLNEISRVEVRFDQSDWQTVEEFAAYDVDLDLLIDVPPGVSRIEIRAVDEQTGVTSETFTTNIESAISSWQKPELALDVNIDQTVSPLDALLVINELNARGPRQLPQLGSPPEHYLDVNGDGFLSAIDALLVINRLNSPAVPARAGVETELGEGEADPRLFAALPERRPVERRLHRVKNTVSPNELPAEQTPIGDGWGDHPAGPLADCRGQRD